MKSYEQELRRIVFFDGVCPLCNGFVDFVIRNEAPSENPSESLLFSPLQGETARTYLSREDRESLQSIVFCDRGQIYREAEAVLRCALYLKQPFRFLAAVSALVPAFLQGIVYRWVARNRYRLFGRKESCRLPGPQEKEKLWP